MTDTVKRMMDTLAFEHMFHAEIEQLIEVLRNWNNESHDNVTKSALSWAADTLERELKKL